MGIHTVRDWRGNKTQLSRCTVDELVGLLAQSVGARQQIGRFIAEVETELATRDAIPDSRAAG